MGIPCGLVINRCDIGDDRIHGFARREHIPVLLEIPFDRTAAEHYARGDVLVEALPRWKEMMLELYRKVVRAVESCREDLSAEMLPGLEKPCEVSQ